MARYLTEFIGTFFLVLTIGLTVLSRKRVGAFGDRVDHHPDPNRARPLPVAWSITGVFGVPVLARGSSFSKGLVKECCPQSGPVNSSRHAATSRRRGRFGIENLLSCHQERTVLGNKNLLSQPQELIAPWLIKIACSGR